MWSLGGHRKCLRRPGPCSTQKVLIAAPQEPQFSYILTQPSSSQTCIQGSGSTPIFLEGDCPGPEQVPPPNPHL